MIQVPITAETTFFHQNTNFSHCHKFCSAVLFIIQTFLFRYFFTDQARVSSTAGGENSVVQMLGSLYDAIENHYGSLATRLYRTFKPKPGTIHKLFYSFLLNL